MQIKRLIYVSLAAMMLSGSLINVPGQAWAAESESATSVSETEKETSTESIDVNIKSQLRVSKHQLVAVLNQLVHLVMQINLQKMDGAFY